MASRKEQKEAARRAREAVEQAEAARAIRRRRLAASIGVALIAIVAAGVAVAISSRDTRHLGLVRSQSAASATYRSVALELTGIPQNGTTLGRASAPVTIQYFGDLECPYCAALTLGEDGAGLPQLITGPVRAGMVKLVYRSMETASAHANNSRWLPQQTAAYAAGEQHLFWQYAELFYHEQGDETDQYVTNSYLTSLAQQIPTLNLTRWNTDRKSQALNAQVNADARRAVSYGVSGTPTLIASGPKGPRIIPITSAGVESYPAIMAAIRAVS